MCNTATAHWEFKKNNREIKVKIVVEGTLSEELAQQVLEDAVQRKNIAIIFGDGINLDMILGGLKKETINDFGRVLKK